MKLKKSRVFSVYIIQHKGKSAFMTIIHLFLIIATLRERRILSQWHVSMTFVASRKTAILIQKTSTTWNKIHFANRNTNA